MDHPSCDDASLPAAATLSLRARALPALRRIHTAMQALAGDSAGELASVDRSDVWIA
jgi:hypothetical protein